MKNYIGDICLKTKQCLKRTFDLKTHYYTVHEYFTHTNAKRDALIIKEMQRLAGITHGKEEFIERVAYKKLLDDNIQQAIDDILKNTKEFYELQTVAYDEAQREIIKNEKAKITEALMSQRVRTIHEKSISIQKRWKKYRDENDIDEPTADMFGEFLVKQKYLTKKQKNKVNVTAIFVDDALLNGYEFCSELDRVKLLY